MPHGKTLRDFLQSNPLKNLREDIIMNIIDQILRGLKVCHDEGLVHGDIRLGSIFMTKPPELSVRINNLGTSALFAEIDDRTKKITRSPLYVAPEVKGIPVDPKSDIWSIGILSYILLSGNYPYTITDMDTLDNLRYQIEHVNFAEEIPKDVDLQYTTEECRNFLLATLENDPAKRPTVDELLNHPWMHIELVVEKPEENLQPIFDKMLSESNSERFFMSTFSIYDDKNTVKEKLREIYGKISNKNSLNFKEFREAFKYSEIRFTNQEIQNIFNKSRQEDKNKIDCEEFENAAFELALLTNQKKLNLFFAECAKDHNGCMNKESLKEYLIKRNITEKEVAYLFKESGNDEGEKVLYADINRLLRRVIRYSMN